MTPRLRDFLCLLFSFGIHWFLFGPYWLGSSVTNDAIVTPTMKIKVPTKQTPPETDPMPQKRVSKAKTPPEKSPPVAKKELDAKRRMDAVLAQMRVVQTRQAEEARRMLEQLNRQQRVLENQNKQLESQNKQLVSQEKKLQDQHKEVSEQKQHRADQETREKERERSRNRSIEKSTTPVSKPKPKKEKVLRPVNAKAESGSRSPADPRSSPEDAGAQIQTMEQYTRFLNPHLTREIREKGIPYLMPRLDLEGREELDHLMRYFDFALVAYPSDIQKRSYFVEIDLSRASAAFRRRDDFNNLGSRSVISLSGEYFRSLKSYLGSRAEYCGPQDGELVVAFVPRGAFQTRYLQWKMLKVCRENGYEPEEVSHCAGTFRRTSFGAWIFLVEDLMTRKGRSVRVRDFEHAKVFGS